MLPELLIGAPAAVEVWPGPTSDLGSLVRARVCGRGTAMGYLFDAGDEGVTRIEFDTLGVTPDHVGGKLSHAFLFTSSKELREPEAKSLESLQVPEPDSLSLALAAMGAAGLMAGRRR